MAAMNPEEAWDLERELIQLQREMNRLQRGTRRAPRQVSRIFPSIIVSTAKDRLVVRAEVPGMKLEDFDISISGDTLTVEGARVTGEGLEGGWYHRRERESGTFSRAVRLPADVDGSKAEATYVAGVLAISVPLKGEAEPRQIPVKVVEG